MRLFEGLKSSFTYAAAARRAAASGRRVIDLTVGEPPEAPPESLLEALASLGGVNHHKYSPSRGVEELRRAIVELERERLGVDLEPGDVVVTPGSKAALVLSLLVSCRPGSRVLVFDPYFYAYINQASVLGVGVDTVAYRVDGGVYRVDLEKYADAVSTGRYCAVIVNTPGNPTGAVLTGEEMEFIVEEAARRGTVVVSDEVYADFVYTGVHRSLLHYGYEGGIYVNSFSKTLFITGWRIGYLVAGERRVAEAAARLAANLYTCAPTPLQSAVARALPEAYREARKVIETSYKARAETLNEAMSAVPGVTMPRVHGGMFGFPLLSEELAAAVGGSEAYASRLLEEKGVAVIPGTIFSDKYSLQGFRISIAAGLDELRRAARLISELNEELLEWRR